MLTPVKQPPHCPLVYVRSHIFSDGYESKHHIDIVFHDHILFTYDANTDRQVAEWMGGLRVEVGKPGWKTAIPFKCGNILTIVNYGFQSIFDARKVDYPTNPHSYRTAELMILLGEKYMQDMIVAKHAAAELKQLGDAAEPLEVDPKSLEPIEPE